MVTQSAPLPARPSNPAGPPIVVWLDRWHALVARSREGRAEVTEIERSFESEPAYLLRVLREAQDCERVVIMGPDADRIAFEREYVALYRRPDRLIDVGTVANPAPSDLVSHLRLLDPTVSAAL